ncbi:Ketosteroid isomerase homolog [Paracoccus isoporae]|uniref:Ketosteroid isomerase homolog n=1 Tax=Paracoccus isoporae TaxID=591205 RepID=A0A1G6YVX8_9RHOB|nr:nuclear transport factor 2 family protein [Paracoccus isoporae]SDD93795.1 Ketosteroid isomerase homolog [Paracoccus isoporae]
MDERDAIQAVLDRQAEAHAAGDAASVMDAYAEAPVLFDLPPPMQVEADAAGLQDWIDGWDSPPRISYRDVEIAVAGDLAMAWGFVRTDTRRDGQEGGFWTRSTWGFRRGAAGWKICHQHNSVPFYMDEDQRAALDLEPGTGTARISEGDG